MSATDDRMAVMADTMTTSATPAAYEPPAVRELGTLADLTLGGDAAGTPDGFGQSGDSGFTGSIS